MNSGTVSSISDRLYFLNFGRTRRQADSMTRKDRSDQFRLLREKHKEFIFHEQSVDISQGRIDIRWTFEMSPGIEFSPGLTVPLQQLNTEVPRDVLEKLAFHIGMIELISYWKAACPPVINIRAGSLSDEAISFWTKIYYLGLGEFRYINGLEMEKEEFFSINSSGPDHSIMDTAADPERIILPVGGGKDSVVSLALLKDTGKEVIPFMVNPLPASYRCLDAAGIRRDRAVIFQRKLDPLLLDLNQKGYLNGHTPYSALLAFNSLLAAKLTGAGRIALSNESSANEPSVPETEINHQYSKSFDFEKDFRAYLNEIMGTKVEYFSFLRPLSELQIAALFSERKEYHPAFLSCNAGSKKDQWCGNCPKCLFTAIILLPFIDIEQINKILGKAIFDDLSLLPVLEELTGLKPVKPFECVGTVDEVQTAIRLFVEGRQPRSLPPLLDVAKEKLGIKPENLGETHAPDLTKLDGQHFLDRDLLMILKRALSVVDYGK